MGPMEPEGRNGVFFMSTGRELMLRLVYQSYLEEDYKAKVPLLGCETHPVQVHWTSCNTLLEKKLKITAAHLSILT